MSADQLKGELHGLLDCRREFDRQEIIGRIKIVFAGFIDDSYQSKSAGVISGTIW